MVTHAVHTSFPTLCKQKVGFRMQFLQACARGRLLNPTGRAGEAVQRRPAPRQQKTGEVGGRRLLNPGASTRGDKPKGPEESQGARGSSAEDRGSGARALKGDAGGRAEDNGGGAPPNQLEPNNHSERHYVSRSTITDITHFAQHRRSPQPITRSTGL